MYRSSVDNTITYTPDDIVLFRESPFAAWMERLTLENPDHGIPPDLNSSPPRDRPVRQDDIVATLRAEGRNVAQIDWEQDEPQRRAATLEAMRAGADFIVNGQFTVSALSGTASLLMRTSGYSALGDFLYIPCETHSTDTLQSAFRLCFIADLLHQVQGQLPPQLLLIRDGAEVVPLRTDDHIHYYRSVLRRFTQAMATFRKHRMPDPAESSHFGRWADCASEVIRQRALSEQHRAEEATSEPAPAQVYESEDEVDQLRVANGVMSAPFDARELPRHSATPSAFAKSAVNESSAATSRASGHTLAEQARMLSPGSFRVSKPPGYTPNLANSARQQLGSPIVQGRHPGHNRRSSDSALENLEFIGSSAERMVIGLEPAQRLVESGPLAPPPTLREGVTASPRLDRPISRPEPTRLPDLEPKAPVFLPPDQSLAQQPPDERLAPPPRIGGETSRGTRSVIDLDGAPAPTLAPVVQRAEAVFERLVKEDPIFRNAEFSRPKVQEEDEPAVTTPFSNSLMTGENFGEN
jgi:hypothetical protein